MEHKQASYKIEHVILIESNFRREIQIDFQSSSIENQLHVETQFSEEDQPNVFGVNLIVTLKGIQNEKEVFYIHTKIGGIFSKSGETTLTEDVFKKVNAPAILFPFIRENIAVTALKGGLGNILLPPINFAG